MYESSTFSKSTSVFTHELKFYTPLWTWACDYTVFRLRSTISIITEVFSKHLSKKCCFHATFHFSVKDIVEYYGGSINPFKTKTPKYLFLRGNKPLLYHQIGNRNFFIFITNQENLMFCVDKIKYKHLAILSNLKSCQFAPRIVIFNLCICWQFEDS